MNTTKKTKNIVLYMDGKPLCAQKNVEIDRSASSIDITSKIAPDWQNNIVGTKSWKVSCSGVFVLNEEAFAVLENAFNYGETVEVKITEGETGYKGNAIITSFPISIDFEESMTYRLKLLGDGPLETIGV